MFIENQKKKEILTFLFTIGKIVLKKKYKENFIKVLDIVYSTKLEIIKSNLQEKPKDFIPVVYILQMKLCKM